MIDRSLMNPSHLQKEIRDLELELIPKNEKLAEAVKENIETIYAMIETTYNEGKPTTLTTEQVRHIIRTLSDVELNLWRFSGSEKFALKVYRALQQDRRWIVGSKLKFLKK